MVYQNLPCKHGHILNNIFLWYAVYRFLDKAIFQHLLCFLTVTKAIAGYSQTPRRGALKKWVVQVRQDCWGDWDPIVAVSLSSHSSGTSSEGGTSNPCFLKNTRLGMTWINSGYSTPISGNLQISYLGSWGSMV